MKTFLDSISTEKSKSSQPSQIQELLKNTAEKIKQIKKMDELTSQLAAQVPTEMLQNAYSHVKGQNTAADEKTKQIQAAAWEQAKKAFADYKKSMGKAGTEDLLKNIAKDYTEEVHTSQPAIQQSSAQQNNQQQPPPQPNSAQQNIQQQIQQNTTVQQNIQQQTVTPPVVQQSTGSDDMQTIEQLGSCVDPSNSIVFMELIVSINEKMEKLKSLRDWKMSKNAKDNGGSSYVTGDYNETGDKQIYTYGDHNNFITSDRIEESLDYSKQVAENNLEIKNGNEVTKLDVDKKNREKFRKEHDMLDGAKAQDELYTRLKQSNVGAFTATDAVKYLGFNVGAFDAKMEEIYKAMDSQTLTDDQKTEVAGYATSGGTKFKQEGEYVSAGDSNDVDTTSALDKNDAVQDNPFYEGITRAIDGVNSLLECLSDDSINKLSTSNTGLDSSNFGFGSANDVVGIYNLVSQTKSIIEKITQLNESRKEGKLFSWDNLFVLSDLLNDLGGVAGLIVNLIGRDPNLSKLVENNLGSAGNSLQILNGIFTLASSAKAIGEANAGIATAQESQIKISQEGMKLKDKDQIKQAARFATMAKRAENKQRHDRANAILDNATGLMDIGAGVANFFPGVGTAIGTGLGLLSSATSFFGKLIINKYFKRKQIEDTFDELLGGKGALDKYMERMAKASTSVFADGRDATKKLHEVLRRATGFTTRAKYADAIAATNAIDLYTAAKANPVINEPNHPAQKIVVNTMASMGIGVEQFRTMTLDDILNGVEVDNWKGAIKGAITQSADFVEEDIKSGFFNKAINVKDFDDPVVAESNNNVQKNDDKKKKGA